MFKSRCGSGPEAMVGRTARRFRHDALKPQPSQIQLADEDVDRPQRIVFSYVVVKELGQQNALPAVLAPNKALHQKPDSIHQVSNPTNVFTQPAPEADILALGRTARNKRAR
jgi:hypothetical protein